MHPRYHKRSVSEQGHSLRYVKSSQPHRRHHQQLLRGEGEITDDYVGVLTAVRKRFPFDVVLHWGENGAVNRFAKQNGLVRVQAN